MKAFYFYLDFRIRADSQVILENSIYKKNKNKKLIKSATKLLIHKYKSTYLYLFHCCHHESLIIVLRKCFSKLIVK